MIWTIIVGAIIGYITCRLMELDLKWYLRIILGIAGSSVGAWLGSLLGIRGGILGFVFAILGSCLLVWIIRKLKK